MTAPDPLALASVLDTAAAGPLRLALRQAIGAGRPLLIDGSTVERAGQACLQVLLAGRAAATGAGIDFRIADPSPALADMVALAGVAPLLAA